ncbi:MAG: hypothetical protein RG741_07605, partial [Bacteroidales bacterium]|nr:hypothetical protein [Bacteroidales bacterium]
AILDGSVTAQNIHPGLGGTFTQNFIGDNTLLVSWTANLGGSPVDFGKEEKLFDLGFTFAGGASAIIFNEASELYQDNPPNYPPVVGVSFLSGSIAEIDVYALSLAAIPGDAGATLTGAGSYQEGETVHISTTVPGGYRFEGWSGSPEDLALLGDPQDTGHSFSMPARHVSLTANFEQLYTVSGILRYANPTGAIRPITNSTVYLKTADGETTIATTTTHATTGAYLFEDVPAGEYQLTASTTKPWQGVDLTDAFLVILNPSPGGFGDPLINKAADVNNSNLIDLTDGYLIYFRAVLGSIHSFVAGDWLFEKKDISIANINLTKDIRGIVVGDVNTTWPY